MASLVSTSGSSQIDLEDGDLFSIGRSSESDLFIDDPSISTLHAYLQFRDNVLVIEDQGSTNGIRVNYTDVEQSCLVAGDILEIGNVGFQVHGDELVIPDRLEYEEEEAPAPVEQAAVPPVEQEMVQQTAVVDLPTNHWLGALVAAFMLLVAGGLLLKRILTVFPPN